MHIKTEKFKITRNIYAASANEKNSHVLISRKNDEYIFFLRIINDLGKFSSHNEILFFIYIVRASKTLLLF